MRIVKIICIILIPSLYMACGSGNQKASNLFEITIDKNVKKITQFDEIGVTIKNKKNKDINQVTYSIDGKDVPLTNNTIKIDVSTLGNKTLTAKINSEGETVVINKNIKVFSAKAPEIYTYTIIKEYPHDTGAYTQGLEFFNDTLYESTGKNGKSFLRKLDFSTGKVYEQINLDDSYFGEGITILNDKIYQLTWKSGLGFIYDLHTLKKLDNFQYGKSREGWGLANDGNIIFKSDGTEKIWFINPNTMTEEGYIETVTNSSIVNSANELEFVDGKLYANVYQKPSVMIINSNSGAIEGVINFSGLSDLITKSADWDKVNNVLNGIAYHPERKTFFVTGKFWDKMFEVKIQKK
ncbi:glutaminyl-peptide cyclotransferase [Maribacter sp. MAR_2009_72]|uniref:glutaminyl-peptide cyclotransferase n=1 Tax=Maribacter sp. MAR_2009_72 TaxID=1250050 RepID=UPI00119B53A8|nr:glutaminyl-peptide cyclotransferase [Maribacter sp. MAR_2009_72]TVZ14423.1 glutamine cyclotransferase [Maribacter sp. MAR_2009_72]